MSILRVYRHLPLLLSANGLIVTVLLKTTDPRLTRNLSYGGFIITFGIYRDILGAHNGALSKDCYYM